MPTYIQNLTTTAKALIGTLVTFAIGMQVDPVKNWVTSNLGQHPKLSSIAMALLGIVTALHNPQVADAARAILNIKKTGPGTAEISAEPVAGTKVPAWVLFGLGLGLMGLMGCAKPTAATPPTAPSPWQRGAQAMNDFSADLLQVQNIEIQLHSAGTIPDAPHESIETALAQVAGYGVQIDSLLLQQATAPTIAAKVQAAMTSLSTIAATAAGLSNAQAANLNAAVAALRTVLTGLLATFTTMAEVSAPWNNRTTEVALGSHRNRYLGRAASGARLADLQPGQGGATRADWNHHTDADRDFARAG